AGAKALEDAVVRAAHGGGVGVHAGLDDVGEQLAEGLLDPLGAAADLDKVRALARRTVADARNLEAAVVAGERARLLVQGERDAAVGAAVRAAAVVAAHHAGVAAAVV